MTEAAERPTAQEVAPFLRLTGIRKSYPGVLALAGFDMEVRRGEVIGLVGENGAGKSTLMKILGGVTQPDSGIIEIDGARYEGLTVGDSMHKGIAFVHQELNLFDNLDVAANVFFGREPRTGGLLNLVDERKMRTDVLPLLRRLGATFAPDTRVAKLSLAQQQMVEIAKALSVNAQLVIFDEPTSSLPLAETQKLLDVIASLKAKGIAVIFISHRLHEVESVCDRVIVLRDGVIAGRMDKSEVTHDRLVKQMIGRDLKVVYIPPKNRTEHQTEHQTGNPPEPARSGAVLSVSGLRTAAYPQETVELVLHRGEILGLAGLIGAGRTELARAIFGIDRTYGGTIALDGRAVTIKTASDAVACGIFLVPEDRKGAGVLLDFTIAENISLPNLRAYARGMLVEPAAERGQAEKSRAALAIKAPSATTRTGLLSGGNQQKVVLAKWLAMQPRVMIFDEPTRGVDIGAKSEIYRLMRELTDAGVAVLMISSDMEEVIGVSDRIVVMHEGRIAGTLERGRFSEENVLLLAVGKTLAPRAA